MLNSHWDADSAGRCISAATTTGRRAAAAWSQAVDCPAAVAAALSVQPFLTDKRAAMKEKAGKGGDSRNSPRRVISRAKV